MRATPVEIPRSTAVLLVLLLGSAGLPRETAAQTRGGAGTPVVHSTATEIVSSRPGPRLEKLVRAQRLSIARSSGLDVGGITSEVTLTASRPYTKTARLVISAAVFVETDEEGGSILLMGAPDHSSTVGAKFRLAHANRPVLVDFAVRVKPDNAGDLVDVRMSGAGFDEFKGLKQDGHVTALVVPKQPGWHYMNFSIRQGAEGRVWVESVEITVLE